MGKGARVVIPTLVVASALVFAGCPDGCNSGGTDDAAVTADVASRDGALADRWTDGGPVVDHAVVDHPVVDHVVAEAAVTDSTSVTDSAAGDGAVADGAVADGGSVDSASDAAATVDAGWRLPPDCDRYQLRGAFSVNSSASSGGASGNFADNPAPYALDELRRDGACAFFGLAAPRNCMPACESPLQCGFEDTCRPWPVSLSVGTVTISGTTPTLTMDPQWGSYYTTQSYPHLYQPGDLITLTASGSSDVDGFTASTRGVAPLVLPIASFSMYRNQPLTISWTPSAPADDSVMLVHLDIDHHAALAAYAECQVADAAGSVTLSAAIVNDLFVAGASGIGTYVENATMTRLTRSVVQTSRGCARFSSESQLWINIDEP